MHPRADEDTRPIRVPVSVQAVRACRPALTRVTGVGMGETFAIPREGRSGLVIGRDPSVDVRVDDEAASRRHARVHVEADGSVVLTDLGSTNGTIVNGRRIDRVTLTEGDKIQVGPTTVLRFALNDRLDETYLEHLYERSIRDALTGLLNRRYFTECLERDLGLARRHGMPLSVLLIDADHFKAVNDAYGHAGGDQVLLGLGELLSAMQRSESLLARHGGEEFAVLLRNVDLEGAVVLAERMRRAVEHGRFAAGGHEVRLTVSIGVAVTTADDVIEPDALVERADRYLYLSKRRGRNCVTSAASFTP